MRHLYLSILVLLFFSIESTAQQFPQFSNYIVNQFAYNPAIPNHGGYLSGRVVHRNQWTGLDKAPVTTMAGLRIGLKKIPIGFGFYAFKDQAGLLQNKVGLLNLSFTQKLSEKAFLSAGVTGQLTSLDVDNNVTLDNPIDNLFSDAASGHTSPDLNVGLMLEYDNLFLGISMQQAMSNGIDFSQLASKEKLSNHFFVTGGYNIQVSDKIAIEPSAIVQIVPDAPLQISAGARLLFNKFWIGGSYRHLDAGMAQLGFNFKNFDVSYAYDLNISNLKSTNSGSHEISVGFRINFSKDSDNDGIADEEDKCPDEPGAKNSKTGCPEEEEEALAETKKVNQFGDDDKDGIPNGKDKCPNMAGLIQFKGCPWSDIDQDGVRDDVDKCPNLTGIAANGGCPIDDIDKDGIVDTYDKCPNIPGTILGGGCPEKDSDNDGVVDALDHCPYDTGAKGNNGCPVNSQAAAFVLEKGIGIRNVYFDTDKDLIRKEHINDLNYLSEFLIENKNVKVQMSGHTDERAANNYNDDLSKRRVEKVMYYLINRGVSRHQIVADYYGELKPADFRRGEEGWQLNRRVELKLIFE